MDLSKIMAISGKPGLHMMLSQTKTGLIVESLTDGKRFPVFAHERVSSLKEISIFSKGEEDIPLQDVFKKFFTKLEGKAAPDSSSDSRIIREFFGEAVPEYDPERVYISDMKKAIGWYNLLLEKNMMEFEEEKEAGESPAENPEDKSKEEN